MIIWFQLNISPFLFIVRYNKNTNVSIPFNLMSSKILNRDALLSIASTLFWHCLINMWFPKETNMNESNEIYFHQEVLHLRGDRIGCVIVRVLASSLGSSPNWVKPKTIKLVFVASPIRWKIAEFALDNNHSLTDLRGWCMYTVL